MSTKKLQLEDAVREAESRRDWKQASMLWDQRASLAPLLPEQLYSMARCSAYAGNLDRARQLLEQAAAGNVPSGQIAMLRADICELGRDHAEALYWRREANRITPGAYWVRFGTARAMQALKYPLAETLAEMVAAMRLPQAEKHGAMLTATLLFKKGDFKKANGLIDHYLISDEERDTWGITVLPGMTHLPERRAARELARGLSGKGKIVDLGCWLGSLSAAMASGLRSNTHRPKPSKVIAFDNFEWFPSYMENIWPGSQFGLKEGEDFLPWFKKMTARWKSLIDVRKADLAKEKWSEGPIALLVADAMKTDKLTRHIMSSFYPSLLPNGYLFHQDFCHQHTWWIHIYHYVLRERFKIVEAIQGCGTVVFQLQSPLSDADVTAALSIDLSDKKLAAAAFEYSLSITHPVDHRHILGAFRNCEINFNRASNAAKIEKRIAALK